MCVELWGCIFLNFLSVNFLVIPYWPDLLPTLPDSRQIVITDEQLLLMFCGFGENIQCGALRRVHIS